jgi:uncharacterized RDD family membrane protein YckC
MFCTRCGTAIAEGNQFCSQCGAPAPAAGTAPTYAPWSPATATGPVARHAGFWRRFAAIMLDGLVLGVPSYALFAVVLGASALTDPEAMTANMGKLGLVYLVSIVGGMLYPALMHSSSLQATVGKLAFGIKVTDLQGQRISFGRAVGRYFAGWISALILYIGYLMAGFTERRQALHDVMCGTLVVSKDSNPAQVQAGQVAPPKLTGGVIAVIVTFCVLPVVLVVIGIVAGAAAGFSAARDQAAQVQEQTEGEAADGDAVEGLYVEVTNNTGYVVTELYVSPDSVDEWEENVIKGDPLGVGETRRVNLNGYSETVFDIKLVDVDGDSYTFHDIDVSRDDIEAGPEDIDARDAAAQQL